ncbi:hypothetical protein FACS189493_1500 [Spirochaetia bacterium]|nr:hypothetical protein FACS189493_1500 [Spirochaetia bacterium]
MGLAKTPITVFFEGPGNDQGNIGKEAETMVFKAGDTVRVKPREWMEALPKWRTGEPVTPDGGCSCPAISAMPGRRER